MPGAETNFEPLWLDAADAEEQLLKRRQAGEFSEEVADRLETLISNGWVVIPGAISAAQADELAAEIDNVTDHPEHFIARRGRKAYSHPSPDVYSDPTFRLIDYHVNSTAARAVIFAPAIAELLHAAFEADINAFQCLTFHYGSQQAMHQDGAYVVVSKPLQFMASWVALEDVTEGSGELTYYTGSHRLDDFLFPDDSKSWHPGKHGQQIHREFLDSIVARSEAKNLSRETFMAKKGDALIWASDLVHGGAKIKNDHTRRSLVSHYCPSVVTPNFSNFTDFYYAKKVQKGCHISSRHYDLRPGRAQKLSLGLLPEPRFRLPAFMGS